MAEQAYSANWNAEVPRLGMPALWRLAIWGGLATSALFAASTVAQQPITVISDVRTGVVRPESDRYDLVKVAATMSFRGARPQSKADWTEKLNQIEDLLGHARG